MTNTETLPAGTIVALVTDETPANLKYGVYRGWVELDESGAWFANLDAAAIAVSDVQWEYTEEYGRLGTVQ